MSFPLRAAVVLLSLSSLVACTKVKASTPVATPALSVPTPESRLVIPAPPVEAPVEVPVRLEPPPAPQTPPRVPTTPATRTPQPAAPQPAVTPPPTSDNGSPPQVLQTTANIGEMHKKASDLLDKAERDLGRVQKKELSRDSQEQYDTAWTFVRKSKTALDVRNYVLAVDLAEKAATIAGILAKS